jgi:primosomal protein N' (replication factor Y) (superfamily II helicase)
VAEAFQADLEVGSWVEVSLRKKRYAGIVKSLQQDGPEGFDALPINAVIDAEPIVTTIQLAFWEWMATWYYCTQGEVMNAALPTYYKLSSQSILVFNPEVGDNFSMLSNDGFLVAEALHIKGELTLNETQLILQKKNIYPVIKELTLNKICDIYEALNEKFKPKLETYVGLHFNYTNEEALENLLNNFTKAPKQLALLLSYIHIRQTEGEVTKAALLKKSEATDAQLKGLVDKEILILEKRTIDRVIMRGNDLIETITLSQPQQEAYDEIENLWPTKNVVLLHGVTGSGKTPIYAKLLQQKIKQGQQALYLLPEIALTAQLIRRLQIYFGKGLALYHSKLSNNERYEIWRKVKDGSCHLIIGARSSLFLPFKNLTCIVVDEEHDSSYKQHEPAPRYHARDAAIYLANLHNAKLLLGSATPSYESFYQALQGKYGYVALNQKYSNLEVPQIQIINAAGQGTPQKGKHFLSPSIHTAIGVVLKQKGQIIIFQNRRGHSPYLQCDVCTWKPGCKNCKSNLTYHKGKNKLKCHLCSSTYALIYTCPQCGNKQLSYRNYGTEKIEEILAEEFPDINIKRMDVDSIKGKHDHDNIIKQFEEQKIQILIGTQMVVKGLDFDNVQLVIIPDGDGLMHFSDFRVSERAFQLIEQVSGRTGRKYKKGHVLLQMYNTMHPLLPFITMHNFLGLYQQEIALRQKYFYPPFSRLLKITFKHKLAPTALKAAQFFAVGLQPHFAKYLLGPEEPGINRIQNLYLQEVIIKLPKNLETINHCHTIINKLWALMLSQKEFSRVTLVVNMDAQ